MLCVVLVTMVVTILRSTITPTIAVACFRWILFCSRIVHMSFHSFVHSACYCVVHCKAEKIKGEAIPGPPTPAAEAASALLSLASVATTARLAL
jgi:hypothetical protein